MNIKNLKMPDANDLENGMTAYATSSN